LMALPRLQQVTHSLAFSNSAVVPITKAAESLRCETPRYLLCTISHQQKSKAAEQGSASIKSSAPSREKCSSLLVVGSHRLGGQVPPYIYAIPRGGTTMATSDSLLSREGRPGAQSDFRPWLAQRYFPEHPGVRTAPCTRRYRAAPHKLRVIDLVAQHDVKANEQLAGHGHFRQSVAFAKG